MRRAKRPERGHTKRRRRGAGAGHLGASPRHPLGVIAQAEKALAAVAKSVNVALLAAMRPYLGLEVIDAETAKEITKRLVSFQAGASESEASSILRNTFEGAENFNRRDVARTIGIQVPEFREEIGAAWRKEHVAKIVNIAPEARERITGYLQEVGERGMRVETFRKRLEEVEGMSYRRARLIARDSVLTVNARLTEERHKAAGIVEYEWLAMSGGSTRDHHAKLSSNRYRYDDPPMGGGTGPNDRGHPGSGIGCRCQQIPVIPEFEVDGPLEQPAAAQPEQGQGRRPPKPPPPAERGEPERAPQPLTWERNPDGNYRSGDGSIQLVRPTRRGPWEMRIGDVSVDLGKRASFDTAERALAQIRRGEYAGIKPPKKP